MDVKTLPHVKLGNLPEVQINYHCITSAYLKNISAVRKHDAKKVQVTGRL